jgi:pimeloyl-ACP methyl ester carboxylesterase
MSTYSIRRLDSQASDRQAQPPMAQFELLHVDVDGLDTAVLTAGSGDPLVFFHGGGTIGGFDALLPLAERFRLILPHHPGFGESGDDPARFGAIRDYVGHYEELFDRLALGAVPLAGTSMGGYVATLFAAARPERVSRLVLVCPYGLEVPEHPTTDAGRLSPEELMGRLTADPRLLAARPSQPDEAFLAAAARERDTLRRISPGRHDPELRGVLPRIEAPTLVLWGEEDRMIPAGQAPVWAELIPGAELRLFPGRGHLLLSEDPAAVAAVADFAGG